MARYILIDNASGYIFGDTADLIGSASLLESARGEDVLTAVSYTQAIQTGDFFRNGFEIVSSLAPNENGFDVFRADVCGSDAVSVVWDGQDQDTIDAVRASCDLVATVRCINV